MSSTPFVVCLIETNTGVDVIQANSLKGARLLMKRDYKMLIFLDGYKYNNKSVNCMHILILIQANCLPILVWSSILKAR